MVLPFRMVEFDSLHFATYMAAHRCGSGFPWNVDCNTVRVTAYRYR